MPVEGRIPTSGALCRPARSGDWRCLFSSRALGRSRSAAEEPMVCGLSAGGGSLERTRLWWPISLLAGKIQGNSSIRARRRANGGQKWASNQSLTGQFPTHPNREFFTALQGIKSGDQRNFRPDQGNPLSSAILAFCSASKSDRPDRSRTLPRRRTRTPAQMLDVAEADFELRGSASKCARGMMQIARRAR